MKINDEEIYENTFRPTTLEDFVGQNEIKESLKVYIEASKLRKESLDHILLYGPPGLGKTTLAKIIANKLNTNIKIINAPAIKKQGDLVAVLSNLNEGDILFIDEIHRIPKNIEEILYPAMEDYKLNIIIGDENNSKVVEINLPPFTLIGATTHYGDLSSPLRSRFGIIFKFNYYNNNEIASIIQKVSKLYLVNISLNASNIIAKRARKTPRIALRLLKRILDYALIENIDTLNEEYINEIFKKLKIDKYGLNEIDIEYLETIINKFQGGPVGLSSIAVCLNEDEKTIEEVVEPYLLMEGFIKKTKSGRIALDKTFKHLNNIK